MQSFLIVVEFLVVFRILLKSLINKQTDQIVLILFFCKKSSFVNEFAGFRQVFGLVVL